MRTIHLCQACAASYLPPEDMRYDTLGLEASPTQCSHCQALGRGHLDGSRLPAALLAELQARLDAPRPRPERQLARSTGPRRRTRGGPASARHRLG
ncbi:hypothetical protein LO771_21035 [Streptacidiphilus sp. ASG 303]|uniref:hypothetical protein n=1 Tax=Streptacidiphilus sp. ASG 303 TaxID=2896847 RepID=UPI001E372D0E|nr:hypothetical protein [Streptacidiphilus sp. ASG 303]MCD0484810.1 hypothetical protein [Streptacidiphilus sp. ASG 303]